MDGHGRRLHGPVVAVLEGDLRRVRAVAVDGHFLAGLVDQLIIFLQIVGLGKHGPAAGGHDLLRVGGHGLPVFVDVVDDHMRVGDGLLDGRFRIRSRCGHVQIHRAREAAVGGVHVNGRRLGRQAVAGVRGHEQHFAAARRKHGIPAAGVADLQRQAVQRLRRHLGPVAIVKAVVAHPLGIGKAAVAPLQGDGQIGIHRGDAQRRQQRQRQRHQQRNPPAHQGMTILHKNDASFGIHR